ncbi:MULTISPECIES: xylulokinase [unclassified Paenibacillus]|uniref:xylulokinase n=1 Tax=unclassified Paenibacillus TaxID=185978 RepID=UPI001C10ACC4|nr:MULTISPECIES: xylulokinase [unclassified Paenibacillus]MBU5441492.1 xylulokinase [Paenibacillus sp. MSJ-34]CAH0118362.1 Xylulose kinase [Paenibacillus sp. CECT 9249]
MSTKYILAHDIGTTGNKATLYTSGGEKIGSAFYGYETHYPQVGWAEQNPDDWWEAVCVSTRKLLQTTQTGQDHIGCVSFSGQMMGCLLVDKRGVPLERSIIWADMRAEAEADWMLNRLGMEYAYRMTGHRISSSYPGPKLLWIKRRRPDIYGQAAKMLQAKDYLAYKMTGAFATDYSDASATNLFDLSAKRWSERIIEACGFDMNLLPAPYPSATVIGEVTAEAAAATGLKQGTSVVIGGGDGCCAAAGAGVMNEGESFNCIGTSSWISIATNEPLFDPAMRTFTFVHLDPAQYVPTGTMQCGGASLQWLKNRFYAAESASASNVYDLLNAEAAASPAGANRLLYLPYLLGERAPRWNPDARGAFIGLHMKHDRGDLARAVMEGVGYNLKIVLDTFRGQGVSIDRMRVLGGGAKSPLWRQILADIYDTEISVPADLEEATSMGAAMAGAVGAGLIPSFSAAKRWIKEVSTHQPAREYRQIYDEMFDIFEQSYRQLLPIYQSLKQVNGKTEG